jgi:hypothetical protein
MSYNGSGTFNINTTGQPVVAGTVISSSAFNALTTDLATGLTTAITKDGQTTTTARITFAQGVTSSLTTDSSSVSTGSIITGGGAGIAKNLYVGVNANVAGTLGVTGVATFSAAPIYSSLTASSAVATDASKGLVSVTNTGTGNNVLATAPTIASLNLTTALTLTGASGTAGQALTSGGSGVAPTWTTISSSPTAITNGTSNVTVNSSGGTITATTNGTTAITVDTSQNVGIGTSSPSYKLSIAGSSATSSNLLLTHNTDSTGAYSRIRFQFAEGNASIASEIRNIQRVAGGSGSNLAFFTENNSGTLGEAARIDTSGNLLVGTTSSNNGGGICLTKSVNGSTIANFENSFGSGGQTLRTSMPDAANNTSSYHIVCGSGNDRLYVYGNGNVVNSNNSYGTLSDVKLKENIVDASSKLAEVMQLKVRNFNLKTEPDHKQIGFIAQELEQVFPALIDNTTSPNDPDDVIKSIKTSVLIPILVKAIQELKAELDELKAKVNA